MDENEVLQKKMIEELYKSVKKLVEKEVHSQTIDFRQSPF